MDAEENSNRLVGEDNEAELKPSYWLDACEDILCDDLITSDLVSLGSDVVKEDGSLDPCFFYGVLDNLPMNVRIENNVCDKISENKVSGNNNGSYKAREYEHGQEKERFGKRAWVDGLSSCSNREIKERPFRKRGREYEEYDRIDRDRDRSSVRRKGEYGNNGRRGYKDMEWREGRGYWERDRLGTNDMVFRQGPWECSCVKASVVKNVDGEQGEVKKEDDLKKSAPKEHARKYQLDVLEQAKNKNTIAFLETGAGKTLIAVLLIKSVCNDMLKQGKKMLAVFLVPKVPLVYQQAEVIREQTGYQVGHYCGEMGQDFWDARRWQREFEKKQVAFHFSEHPLSYVLKFA